MASEIPVPPSTFSLEPAPEELRRLLEACARFAAEYVGGLWAQPSWDLHGAEELAHTFREAVPEEGRPLAEILERLRPALTRSLVTAGPGCFAAAVGGGIPSSACADLLAGVTGRRGGAAAPALAQLEATTLGWLAREMGLPPGAGGVLTSGTALSHLGAVVSARAARLPEDFRSGTLYLSEETHPSITWAARIAGFPADAVRRLAVDARLRLTPEALERAVEEDRRTGRHPFLIVASAGTWRTGAIDPLPELAAVARRNGLWLHVDGGYGGFFRLAPAGAERLRGIEAADSIALDPDKGLFLPSGTGCLLARDPGALRRAHAPGIEPAPHEVEDGASLEAASADPGVSALRLWLPIQLHGLGVFREQLAEKLALARWAWERLRGEPLLEVLDEPQLSVLAVRGRPPRGDADDFTARLVRGVNARRRVAVSGVAVGGRRALRLCILGFRSHQDRVGEAIEALVQEARALAA